MAASRSRRLRGGGKYSSSSVIRTSSNPFAGARRSSTASTSSSGADAPAVTPTVPDRSSGSSAGSLIRYTRSHPAARASFSSATVFEEFAEPITTTESHRSAMFMSADWRLVVAKHRSERPGIHISGKRSFVASATSAQSRCESVVWARSATGVSKAGSASTSAIDSTRCTASGATAMVPTASSWPSWPTYTIEYPRPARTLTSWCTLVTSGQTASTTNPPRERAAATTSGAEPWAESITGRPCGTSSMSSTNTTPRSSKRFTTRWLCTIS